MPVFRLHKQKHFLPYKENYVFTPDVQFYERPKSDYKKPALSTFTFQKMNTYSTTKLFQNKDFKNDYLETQNYRKAFILYTISNHKAQLILKRMTRFF